MYTVLIFDPQMWFDHILRRHLPLKNRQGSTITLTLNEQMSVFPHASTAVQVTAVLPGGKKEPDGGVQIAVPPVTVGGG